MSKQATKRIRASVLNRQTERRKQKPPRPQKQKPRRIIAAGRKG